MKFIIAFAFLIAGISASALPKNEEPSLNSERIVTGQIENAINDASQAIKDAGLDPLIITSNYMSYALPVPVLFNADAGLSNILSVGLSDIRINRLSYNILTNRLTFDLELPNVHISAGSAFARATIFGEDFSADVSGSVDVKNIRVTGVVAVRVGIISGISLRSVTVNFTLGSIVSSVRLSILKVDLSGQINTFLQETIPNTLDTYKNDINQLLEIYLFDIISANL